MPAVRAVREKFFFGITLCAVAVLASCVSDARAEEYYGLGEGYFTLKKYPEAKNWFLRAQFNKKTKEASLYYLGRIAFEQGEYGDALAYFESIISKDEENVTALKAAAYTCAKTGDAEKALAYYRKSVELAPDGDIYNYMLLLQSLGLEAQAEGEILEARAAGAPLSDETVLLLARLQKILKKPEAIDTYAEYLEKKKEAALQFEMAEAIFAFDEKSEKGAAVLSDAIKNGFAEKEKVDALLDSTSLGDEAKKQIADLFPQQ
jgi:tetratricopeptide (TPR) repeat protein